MSYTTNNKGERQLIPESHQSSGIAGPSNAIFNWIPQVTMDSRGYIGQRFPHRQSKVIHEAGPRQGPLLTRRLDHEDKKRDSKRIISSGNRSCLVKNTRKCQITLWIQLR